MEGQEKGTKRKAVVSFLKRNAYYVAVVLAIIALAGIVAISTANNVNIVDPNDQTPVNNETPAFFAPVDEISILKDYNGTDLLYNSTLNRWEAHKSIDFDATAGTQVFAVSDGTVSQIYETYLGGTTVVITHADGLKSLYSSLESTVPVSVGATVTGGQVIGTVGTTANGEFTDGAHLHFELYENNVKINPSTYLTLSDK